MTASVRETGPTLAERLNDTRALSAFAVALGMGATVGIAIGFEKIGGYIPCMLCLQQRIPYYVGIPLMTVALVLALFRFPSILTRGLLVAGGVLMLYSFYLGAFHSGVEWGWWTGPHDCGVVAAPDTGVSGSGILDAINTVIPPLVRHRKPSGSWVIVCGVERRGELADFGGPRFGALLLLVEQSKPDSGVGHVRRPASHRSCKNGRQDCRLGHSS